MARQFQQPNIPQQPTPEEAFANPLGKAIQTLPELYTAYKMRRKQQSLEDLKYEMEKKKLQAQYGTGAPSPTDTLPLEGPPTADGQYPSMEVPFPEGPEAQLTRLGTEGFSALTNRKKAEQEKPSRLQLRVTDKNVSVLYNPTDGAMTIQATGEPYNASVHGGIRLPGDPNQSNEGIRREGLVGIGRQALADIRANMTPDVLRSLKIVRNDPLGGYEQITSSEAKVVLNNLRTAIENQLYLKTGATATEDETRNAMRKFLAGVSDTPGDFENRLKILERDFSGFTKTPGKSAPASAQTQDNDPLGLR